MGKTYLGPKSQVKRIPDRGQYDDQTLFSILDEGHTCHIGFCIDGQPFVIPTLYGRDGSKIYVHGATTSRMLKNLEKGIPVCLTVTHVDGLVLARSAFHHSMNYRSAVIFGNANKVEDAEKEHALELISENILPGRWEEVRKPNAKELKATTVMSIEIEEASSKIRNGPPSDDKEDLELGIWAGVVPLSSQFGSAEADEFVKEEPVPGSVKRLYD
jgi:nitroimidazol reductase NimA-like FMN-containing flavoprotein (pyridoxamine 5'-phosphate oxidase superfamily)